MKWALLPCKEALWGSQGVGDEQAKMWEWGASGQDLLGGPEGGLCGNSHFLCWAWASDALEGKGGLRKRKGTSPFLDKKCKASDGWHPGISGSAGLLFLLPQFGNDIKGIKAKGQHPPPSWLLTFS